MTNRFLRTTPIAVSLVFALALALAAGASGERKVECAGNICVSDDGGISPTKLPRHGAAPVTARLIAGVESRDGTHPPALQSVRIDVDKTLAVDAVGLPTCRRSQLEATSSTGARRTCGKAIVGSGEAEVEVAFPEQAPFRSAGPLLLFNGGVSGGTTTVLLHAYVDVPAPTAIVVKATISRIHEGPYGMRIQARVPKIAGGAGSVTHFMLKVGRRYTYKGRKKSFLSAGCPTGSWRVKGHAEFSDGTALGLTHLFSCTPTDAAQPS
jgi:hypothetical protein